MVDGLREAATLLGIQHADAQVGMDGAEKPALQLQHGNRAIFGVQTSSKAYLLLCPLLFSKKDAQAIADLQPEQRRRLLLVTRREMLHGRTGFTMIPHPDIKEGLAEIRLEQKWVAGKGSHNLQRLTDAMQEIATVAVRVQDVLGNAFSQPLQSTGTQTATTEPDHVFV